MERKLYIGTNTKMYKNIRQTIAFLEELGCLTRDMDREMLELFVIPSYTVLEASSKAAQVSGITLGAQNMNWEDEGQFTGEISPLMLKEAGVQVVCVGHSERRHIFGESDEVENKKVLAALRHHLIPLLCVGETAVQKDLEIANEVLRTQLKVGLRGTGPLEHDTVWIAYEPVWAIGAGGTPAGAGYVCEKHAVIRETLQEIYGRKTGAAIPILYGGSVSNSNAPELIQVPNVDGLFIGRSAWDANNFSSIIHNIMNLINKKTEENVL